MSIPPVTKKRSRPLLAVCFSILCVFSILLPAIVQAAVLPAKMLTVQVGQIFTKTQAYSGSEAFTYQLTSLDAASPMPAGSENGVYTFTLTGDETLALPAISFAGEGTYLYTMQQVVANQSPGLAYDTEVYTLTVYMQSTSAEYVMALVITNSQGQKVDSIVFENTFTPLPTDPSLMTDPPVNKSVTGNPDNADVFTFKLVAQNAANPMPAGSVNGEKTITVTGGGSGEFGQWAYTVEGTYYYTVYEVNTGISGYQYDTMAYTITDVVTQVGYQLTLNRTVTNSSGKAVTSLDFVNHYTATDAPVTSLPTQTGPKTGDAFGIGKYKAIFCIALLLFFACVIYLLLQKRRKKETSTAE